MNATSYAAVTAPIGFDLRTGEFTNIDGYRAMILKDLCPDVNIDSELNRIALCLVANPASRPDGALGLIALIVKKLRKAQQRFEQLAAA
jgi:hypothetical protein